MPDNENSPDPQVHRENLQRELDALIQHAREDLQRVDEPGFQALLEVTVEVLSGLHAAYTQYGAKRLPPKLPPP